MRPCSSSKSAQHRAVTIAWLLALFAATLSWAPDAACTPAATPGKHQDTLNPGTLRVGIYASAPFVMHDGPSGHTGMGVELWQRAANDLGWKYEYEDMNTIPQLIQALQDGRIDVGITNLTVTQSRAQQIDFTQPWYRGGLQIMIYERARAGTGITGIIAGLSRAGYLLSYAWIFGIIVAATILLTLFDRHFDKSFPQRWRDGIAESFYAVMSIATSGKLASRKNLFGWIGRIWQGLWLVCGIVVLAYVTSSVTSVMTAMALTGRIHGVADLAGKTVGVREGSTGEEYASGVGLSIRRYDNIDAAVVALQQGKVSALIADAPVLRYYANTHKGSGTVVVGNMLTQQNYAFALQMHSALTKRLTVELLGLKKSGYLETLRGKYLGTP